MKYYLRFNLVLFLLIVNLYLNLYAFKLNDSNSNSDSKLILNQQLKNYNVNNSIYSDLINNNNEYSYVDLAYNISSTSNVSLYNSNQEKKEERSLVTRIFLSIIYTLIILATLIGNMLVILAVIIVRKLHSHDNANNLLIVSLAVSDFLVGIIPMPFALYVDLNNNEWKLGAFLCDLWTLSDVLLCTASILNLCAISIDRYFIILHAMRYTQKRNAKLMFFMIFIVWFLSATISIPPLFGWGKPSALLKEKNICAVSSDWKYQIYATLLSFYLPLIVMIIIYITIFRAAAKIKKRERETAGRLQNTSSSFNHTAESMIQIAQIEPLLKNKTSAHSESSILISSENNNNSTKNNKINNKKSNKKFLKFNLQVNPFDRKTNTKNDTKSKKILIATKKSTSESEQGSIESKLYHTSLSSQDNILNHKENIPVSTVVMSSSLHKGGSHITVNTNTGRRGSFGRKFGRRLTQAFAGIKRNSSSNASSGKNQKATRTLGVIMGCFTLCWLPFFILAIIKPIRLSDGNDIGYYVPKWLDSLLLWLGYLNSTLNPMIYARFNREFRRPFIEILCFRCNGINDKLRDEERKKMNFSQSHQNSTNNHLAVPNFILGTLAPLTPQTNSEKQLVDIVVEESNQNMKDLIKVEANENQFFNKEENNENTLKPLQSEHSVIDLNVFKQQIENKKHEFFYGSNDIQLTQSKEILNSFDLDGKSDEKLSQKTVIENNSLQNDTQSFDQSKNNNNLENEHLNKQVNDLSLNKFDNKDSKENLNESKSEFSNNLVSENHQNFIESLSNKEVNNNTHNLELEDIYDKEINKINETEVNEKEKLINELFYKDKDDLNNKLNTSSTKSSIITNDSSNYYESSNSIFDQVEETLSFVLSSSYYKSMDSASIYSKQSSSLGLNNNNNYKFNNRNQINYKDLSTNSFLKNKYKSNKSNSINTSITQSSVQSIYSTVPTSPVDQNGFNHSEFNENNQLNSNHICSIKESNSDFILKNNNSSKSETSKQRKLLKSNSKIPNFQSLDQYNDSNHGHNNQKNNKSRAYCTFNRQRKMSPTNDSLLLKRNNIKYNSITTNQTTGKIFVKCSSPARLLDSDIDLEPDLESVSKLSSSDNLKENHLNKDLILCIDKNLEKNNINNDCNEDNINNIKNTNLNIGSIKTKTASETSV